MISNHLVQIVRFITFANHLQSKEILGSMFEIDDSKYLSDLILRFS